MPITDHKNYPFSFQVIDIKKIDPSPYQHRKYFDEDSLRELGASIVRDGLIEPIIVRPQKKTGFSWLQENEDSEQLKITRIWRVFRQKSQ